MNFKIITKNTYEFNIHILKWKFFNDYALIVVYNQINELYNTFQID